MLMGERLREASQYKLFLLPCVYTPGMSHASTCKLELGLRLQS